MTKVKKTRSIVRPWNSSYLDILIELMSNKARSPNATGTCTPHKISKQNDTPCTTLESGNDSLKMGVIKNEATSGGRLDRNCNIGGMQRLEAQLTCIGGKGHLNKTKWSSQHPLGQGA